MRQMMVQLLGWVCGQMGIVDKVVEKIGAGKKGRSHMRVLQQCDTLVALAGQTGGEGMEEEVRQVQELLMGPGGKMEEMVVVLASVLEAMGAWRDPRLTTRTSLRKGVDLMQGVSTMAAENTRLLEEVTGLHRELEEVAKQSRSEKEKVQQKLDQASQTIADLQAQIEQLQHNSPAGVESEENKVMNAMDAKAEVVVPETGEGGEKEGLQTDRFLQVLKASDAIQEMLRAERNAMERERDELREQVADLKETLVSYQQVGQGEEEEADTSVGSVSQSIVAGVQTGVQAMLGAAQSAVSTVGRVVTDYRFRLRSDENVLTEREVETMDLILSNYTAHVRSDLPHEFELDRSSSGEVRACAQATRESMSVAHWIPDGPGETSFSHLVYRTLDFVCRYQESRASRTIGTSYPSDPTNLVCLELAGWLASIAPHALDTIGLDESITRRRRYLEAICEMTEFFPSPRKEGSFLDTLRLVNVQLETLQAVSYA